MIRTALALAARGFHIFPCRPRDKRPATANGLKDATTDPDIIQAWWQQQPDNNIAIATGAASGIFVVDVDGLDAEAALRRLEAEHGALPATVEVITARGRHIYFKWPQEPVRNSAGKIGTHIDVRGDGGYVIVPAEHPSQRPPLLLERRQREPHRRRARLATGQAEWRRRQRDAVPGMARADRGRRRRRTRTAALQGSPAICCAIASIPLSRSACCRPGTPPTARRRCRPRTVERIVNSIAGKELRRRGNG